MIVPEFTGVRVFVSGALPFYQLKQVGFPKSRKRRIREKWRKDRRRFQRLAVEGTDVFMIQGSLFVSPRMHLKIVRETSH